MGIESLEVLCSGSECGDPVASGGIKPVITRSHRRMNYMGVMHETWPVLDSLLSVAMGVPGAIKPGRYHKFECPVCSSQKIYHESPKNSISFVAERKP